MSDFKLYLLIDHATSNIKSFEEDTIADSHTNYGSLSEIGFEKLQSCLVVEVPISSRDYSYVNPFTGKFLKTDTETTSTSSEARMTWKSSNLVNWSFKNTKINLKLVDIALENIRIIWCKDSLKFILNFLDRKHLNYLNDFIECREAIKGIIDKNVSEIIYKEQELIKKNCPKEKKLIITAGSQAAGKSSAFSYATHELVTYKESLYYEVDSDRYYSDITIVQILNNLSFIAYKNYQGMCVNSYKNISDILKFCSNPHKHIEWSIEQFCLTNNYNFIKQGTRLWLDHLLGNKNYTSYNKTILFFWIEKSKMKSRLERRLSSTTNVRYYYSIQSAISQYDSDWFNIAQQLMIIHYNEIFLQKSGYNFCFILENNDDTKSCFNSKFTIEKQGIMTPHFFIILMLYLTNKDNLLSSISKTIIFSQDYSILSVPESLKKKEAELLSPFMKDSGTKLGEKITGEKQAKGGKSQKKKNKKSTKKYTKKYKKYTKNTKKYKKL